MANLRYYPGSIEPMATVKRSISFDPDLLREAEELAQEEKAGNLSALVAEALEQRVKSRRLLEAIEDFEREFGPIPEEIRDEVDREWRELRG